MQADLGVPVSIYEIAAELAEALRLTQEYVGDEMLPPLPGWSWFDALARYEKATNPADLAAMRERLRDALIVVQGVAPCDADLVWALSTLGFGSSAT